MPLMVDLDRREERIKAIKRLHEVGLSSQVIYNSINEHWTNDEVQALKDCDIRSAVILAFSSNKVLPKSRLEVLTGYDSQKGLLDVVKDTGVNQLLVDVGVVDVPSIGLAAMAVSYIKETLGLPSGCGPCNAITTWKKGKKQFGKMFAAAASAADVFVQAAGADFIMYGPIEDAERAFAASSTADALRGYCERLSGNRPKQPHPLYKVF